MTVSQIRPVVPSVAPASLAGPDRGALLNLIEDAVAAREEAERLNAELRDSESRFRQIVDALPAAIYTTDAQGRITHFNPAAVEFSGRTPQLGTDQWCTTWKLYRSDGTPLPHAECPMAVTLKEGEAVRGAEAIAERPDGTRVCFTPYPTPLHDAQGKITGAVNMLVDISERKQAEATLREAGRRKDEFLAMLAHELRGPLAPLASALEILRQREGADETAREAVAMAGRQMRHLARLVDDLLDAGRIRRGKLVVRRRRVELAPLVRQAAETIGPAMSAAGHVLTVMLPEQAVWVHGDAVRLVQVLDNLLANACKYTEPGGRISLAVEREGGEVVIAVKDSGIGIAPEVRSRLFKMFVQADQGLARAHGGLGIGLALVRRLVKMHGGTVQARSEGLGKGSEFVVRLPMLTDNAARPFDSTDAPGTAAAASALRVPRRILVVDDNRDSAHMLVLVLGLAGHEARAAHDGEAAVAAAEAFRPEVVLMDIGLPVISGYEAARRIRAQPWGRDMLLVAATGWGQDKDRQESAEAGFDSHLVKPLDLAVLEQLLAELPARGR